MVTKHKVNMNLLISDFSRDGEGGRGGPSLGGFLFLGSYASIKTYIPNSNFEDYSSNLTTIYHYTVALEYRQGGNFDRFHP